MISESLSTLWTRLNLTYSVNFAFGIAPNILEPLGSSSYRSHLFIYLFIYLFFSFHDVWLRSGKSHLQVFHVPGSEPRPLSVLYEKRNGTLDFLTASGNNCQGIWRSSGNSLFVFQFFLSLSQSEQRHIFRTWSCRDGDQRCVKRERGFQSLKSRNTNVDLFGSTQGHWLAKKYRVTFSANQNTNPKSIHVRLLRAFHALGSVFATLDNTIIIFLSPSPPKNLHNHCFQFLLGLRIVPRETENNGYAKLWRGRGGGDKKIIMVFSKVANPRFSLEIRLVHSLVCVSWTYFPLCSLEVNQSQVKINVHSRRYFAERERKTPSTKHTCLQAKLIFSF